MRHISKQNYAGPHRSLCYYFLLEELPIRIINSLSRDSSFHKLHQNAGVLEALELFLSREVCDKVAWSPWTIPRQHTLLK